MKVRGVLAIATSRGCEVVKGRGKGSHRLVKCPGGYQTIVPGKLGDEVHKGALRSIERGLQKCLGKDWLSKGT